MNSSPITSLIEEATHPEGVGMDADGIAAAAGYGPAVMAVTNRTRERMDACLAPHRGLAIEDESEGVDGIHDRVLLRGGRPGGEDCCRSGGV